MGLLKALWDCLRGKAGKEQPEKPGDSLPEKPVLKAPLPPPIRKGSLEDIRDFCDEVRKDLKIRKKTDDRLYVEIGNIKSKIERFLERHKEK